MSIQEIGCLLLVLSCFYGQTSLKIVCQCLKDLVEGSRSFVFVTFLALQRLVHDFLSDISLPPLGGILMVLVVKSSKFLLNAHFSSPFCS